MTKKGIPVLKKLTSKPVPKMVIQAASFVADQKTFLDRFSGFDDFIFRADEEDAKKAKAVEHNLRTARAGLARMLWSHEIFIGIEVIDRILYDIAASGTEPDLVKAFFKMVAGAGLHHPGFVLYPLHSFGVLGLGFARFFHKTTMHLILADAGLAVTTQTNSLDATLIFLEQVRRELGIDQRLPVDTIRHFARGTHRLIL